MALDVYVKDFTIRSYFSSSDFNSIEVVCYTLLTGLYVACLIMHLIDIIPRPHLFHTLLGGTALLQFPPKVILLNGHMYMCWYIASYISMLILTSVAITEHLAKSNHLQKQWLTIEVNEVSAKRTQPLQIHTCRRYLRS